MKDSVTFLFLVQGRANEGGREGGKEERMQAERTVLSLLPFLVTVTRSIRFS
jgi:hypothetical protein